MEQREGYKKTKIGWIPKSWDVIKLGNIGFFKNGINKGKEDFGKGIPFVNLMDVFGYSSISKKEFGLVNATIEEQKKYDLIKGDVLFIRSSVKPSGVGLTALVEKDIENTVYSGFLIRYRENEKYFTNKFKKFCFYERQFRNRLLAKSSVSANTNINQTALSSLLIGIPSLPEQKKIASILTKVDDKISSIENQIQQTEQLKKGLMEKLLTEGIGHTEFKDTKIGRIPTSWGVVSLDRCCDAIQDGTHFSPHSTDGPFKYLTSKNIKFGCLDLTNTQYISEEDHTSIFKRCPVQYGDVLLTKDGAKTGNVALNTLKEPFSLLSSVAFIRTQSTSATNLFILQYFLSPKGQKMIKDAMAGQAITRITLTKIKAFKVPAPPIKEQKQIASILSSVDNKIEVLTQKKSQYQTLKKGLMQQLLTGQMRVKV